MNTEALIAKLARDLRPVEAGASTATLRRGWLLGGATALAGLLLWPSLGVRQDIVPALLTTAFWIKAFYTLSVAWISFTALDLLGRPDAEEPQWLQILAPPLVLLVLVTILHLAITPKSSETSFWMGASWRQCPVYVVTFAAPVYAGLMFALSRLAPTRLRAAGATAGLVAGATGATIYGLHCAESSPGFVMLWYSLGLAASGFAGAVAGPRLLRW
ncbi:DUF1109 domain-containing protein [Sphingobium sp. AS12]|uniref:NrsF family protein n=1 Tax=Sphingobium sp. AS12 TaxID=2849495 RepID=UPI001C31A2B5|nr:DUF1109 domain-containing protein [Sphingobium sp. AS12]MBV2150095.1 DUF1109 domain-containing protein [Sphingobium sp. AS12]